MKSTIAKTLCSVIFLAIASILVVDLFIDGVDGLLSIALPVMFAGLGLSALAARRKPETD